MCVSISVLVHTFPRPSTLLFIPLGQLINPSVSSCGLCAVAALIYNACFSQKSFFTILNKSNPHQNLKLILSVRGKKCMG